MSPPSLRHPARMAGASLLRLQSDERLAGLAADSHEAAFDAIVDRYRTPLTRYCAGIVGPSRAEDAVQQALINAHDALQRTDEVRHLRSWLYRIAHNASLNVLRAVRDDVSLDAASDATAVAEDGPAAAFERSERFRATVDALRELPERQRAALVLRELEGRSHEEIAAALGVTKGSARQHLMRARVALRGAVTAITPYPLIVRLAEMIASPSAAGWTDAAVGAGAGATLAKLTAGVAATGALVGGAVGTERVVHHRHSGQDAAQRSTGGSATVPSPVKARAVSLPATTAAGGGGGAAPGSGQGSASSGAGDRTGEGKDKHNDRGGSRDGSGQRRRDGSGGNKGSADSNAGNGSRGRGRGNSGSGGGSSHGSDQSADRNGSGRHGSSGGDDGRRDGSSESGSSGSRGDSSGRSKSSGSEPSGSSSGGDDRESGSGRSGESSNDSSGPGSGSGSSSRDSGDLDSSSPTTTAAPVPAPMTTSPTESGSGSDSGSGGSESSGSDDGASSSDRSGSSNRSGSG